MKTLIAAMAASVVLAGHAVSSQCPPSRVVSPSPWERADFGEHVRVRGDVAVVGDPGDDSFCSTAQCNSGAVHVFRQQAAGWELEATLYHSRISEYDGFGDALAMDSADRFAATAIAEDVAGRDTGAIYIFEHNGEAWGETAEILPVEPEFQAGFGVCLALQDDTLIVGQYNDACWVYRQRSGEWELDQKIASPDPLKFTRFGEEIALDGDWLAVGASGAGVVHLYRGAAPDNFEFVTTLTPPDPERSSAFGAAVAMEDGRLVVGAWALDSRIGAAFVYELEGGSWTLQAELRGEPVEYSDFGDSVALHGDTIVVGADNERFAGGTGAVYIFRRQPDGSWRRAARLVPDSPPSGAFGASVATDGASIIVGAPGEPVGAVVSAGAAHIFDLGCLLCRADLDSDGELTFFDFLAFQNLFAAGDLRADFDGDGELTFFDFLAFQAEFTAGCD